MPTLPRFHDLIDQQSNEVAALIRTGDLDAPVPSCPGWTLTDLAVHLGVTQRWATEIVRTGERAERSDGPRDREALERWFVEGARELSQTLRTSDPQAPAWNFGPPPRVAAFWSRRMAQEVAVHLWDAMASQGLDFTIDAELAADGIDEVSTMFVPMRVRAGALAPSATALLLEPTDVPDASVLVATGDVDERVALRGPAQLLLLVLWGRSPLAALDVDGDAQAAAAVLGTGLTP